MGRRFRILEKKKTLCTMAKIRKFQIGGYQQPSNVYTTMQTGAPSAFLLESVGKVTNKVFPSWLQNAMTYVSPLNYLAAISKGSIDPKVGEQEIATWHPTLQLLGRAGEITVGPKVIKGIKKGVTGTTNLTIDVAAQSGNKTAKSLALSREINRNVNNTKLISRQTNPSVVLYQQNPMVFRTSALGFKDWIKGEKPRTFLDDPNSAFIELRSHPDGHATVKTKHLVDRNGNDITFTFDREPRSNLLQLEFDDSHGAPVRTLTPEEVEHAVKVGLPDQNGKLIKQWIGSPVAKEVEEGHPRSITFRNMTPEQADQTIEFIDQNTGKNIYVHCLRGTSRSGAFDKFLGDYYGYSRPITKNVDGASPEVYNTLVEAWKRKHENQKPIATGFFK